VEARVAELVATRRPELERLVRDAVDAELAAPVDRELNAVTERLAARKGSTPAGAEALPMANPAGSSRPSLGLEVVSRSEARRPVRFCVVRTILVLVAVAATLAAAADATSSRRFVSKSYSYSIVLPGDWTSSPASIRWRGGPPFQNTPEVDIYDATDGRELAVAALSLPGTTTLRKWATLYVGTALPGFCKKSRGYRATTLGGAPALAFTGRCDVHNINVALTVRRGRGYTFVLASPRADSEAADGGVFEAARRSFRFVR
jgi:hypothetical protein